MRGVTSGRCKTHPSTARTCQSIPVALVRSEPPLGVGPRKGNQGRGLWGRTARTPSTPRTEYPLSGTGYTTNEAGLGWVRRGGRTAYPDKRRALCRGDADDEGGSIGHDGEVSPPSSAFTGPRGGQPCTWPELLVRLGSPAPPRVDRRSFDVDRSKTAAVPIAVKRQTPL
jgi:hypothetical protein